MDTNIIFVDWEADAKPPCDQAMYVECSCSCFINGRFCKNAVDCGMCGFKNVLHANW